MTDTDNKDPQITAEIVQKWLDKNEADYVSLIVADKKLSLRQLAQAFLQLSSELKQLRAERAGLDSEIQSRIDSYNGETQNLFYIVRVCCEAYEDAKAKLAEVENLKGDRDTMHPDKQKALFKFREAEKVGALQWLHLWELVQQQDDIIKTLKSKLTDSAQSGEGE